MGGAITYVYRDGSRLTPWMLHQINQLDNAFRARFGLNLRVSSGIRTHEEQRAIFLARYTRTPDGRRVYDTRWWNGAKWYRVSPAGTVAVPGTSNHEIQGSKAAVDVRDTGRDAGVTTRGTVRANWLRANAPKYGLVASGYYFGEPWHFDVLNIFTPIAVPATVTPEPAPVVEEPAEDLLEDNMRIFGYKNPNDKNRTYYVEFDSTSGYWHEWVSTDGDYIKSYADKWAPLGIPLLSVKDRDERKAECDRISGRTAS